jgi:hypothetical protein
MRAKLPAPLATESKRERALMAARKKTRRSSTKKATRKSTSKKATRKSTTAKKTRKKAAAGKAAKAKRRRAGKSSPKAGDVVYSDLRKVALARALARR